MCLTPFVFLRAHAHCGMRASRGVLSFFSLCARVCVFVISSLFLVRSGAWFVRVVCGVIVVFSRVRVRDRCVHVINQLHK